VSGLIQIPTRVLRGQRWADFSFLARKHQLCAEGFNTLSENVSYVGGHRVRLYVLKGNVHWRVPEGVVDITNVAPATEPPRRQPPRG
jgi:hypothetical protein